MADVCGTIAAGNILVSDSVKALIGRKGWQSDFANHDCFNCVKGNIRHDCVLTRLPSHEPVVHRDPAPPSACRPFEVVHTDICVVAKPGIFGIGAKKRYVVGFVDEFSGHAHCCIINSRKDLPAAVKKYVEHLHQNQLIASVVNSNITLQSDNEYDSAACKRVYLDCGIKPRLSAAKSPTSNARIERFWGTITPAIVRVLGDSQLPLDYWDACLYHVVDIYNSLGHRTTNYQSPNNLCFQKPTNHQKLALFGAPTAMLVEKPDRKHKFSQRARFGLYLGFAPDHSQSSCALTYDPGTKHTSITRHQKHFDFPEHADVPPLQLVTKLNATTDKARANDSSPTLVDASRVDQPVNAGSQPFHAHIASPEDTDIVIASVTRTRPDGTSEVEEHEVPFEDAHAFRSLVARSVQAVLPLGVLHELPRHVVGEGLGWPLGEVCQPQRQRLCRPSITKFMHGAYWIFILLDFHVFE